MQHVERGRRRHRRLPRGAAQRGDRLRRHARRRDGPHRRRSSRSPSDPPEMPGPPGHGARQHGHLRLPTREFLIEQLRRDAADPHSSRDFGKDIIPYLVKHGKAVAHRFTAVLRALARRGRGLLARRRHGRRLLGGQHRPHRRRAGARPLRPRLADLDLRRDHAAGEVRARRGRPARHRRSRRWSPAAASSPARRCAARCCSPACTCTPTRTSRTRSSCPMSTSAAARGCTNVVVDRGVRIPAGPRRRRGSRARRAALPPHRQAASASSRSR